MCFGTQYSTVYCSQPSDHLLVCRCRDAEIEDLKTQLSRMQEDWIEEECHRVEAQLALKEARKEIKQLKQVIDTVKNNLIEKDKGLQKYFVDINIQNKKLETLLHSMEVAQNGTVKEEGHPESAGGSPARSLTRSSTYTKLSDQGATDRNIGGSQTISVDDGADSGFVAAENSLSRTDLLDHSSLLSSGVECVPDDASSLHTSYTLGSQMPTSSTYEKLMGSQQSVEAAVQASCMQEQAIQTDFGHYQPDLDTILEKVMKSQAGSLASPTSEWPSEIEEVTEPTSSERCVLNCSDPTDRTAAEPSSAVVIVSDGEPSEKPDSQPGSQNPAVHQPCSASPSVTIVCTPEDEATEAGQDPAGAAAPVGASAEPQTYWSRHFLVDLLAVVVPAVPTVAWLCRSQRRQGQPIYNISSLLRGCCTVALHSIRKISCRSVTNMSSTCSQP